MAGIYPAISIFVMTFERVLINNFYDMDARIRFYNL